MKWIKTQTIIIPNSLVEFSSTLTGAPLGVCALSVYGLAHSPTAAHQQVRPDSRLLSQQRWPCLPRRKVGATFFGRDVCHSCHLSYHQIKPFPLTRSCAILQPSFFYPCNISSVEDYQMAVVLLFNANEACEVPERSNVEKHGDLDSLEDNEQSGVRDK